MSILKKSLTSALKHLLEVCDAQLIPISVDFGLDVAWTTLIGGDWSLNIEYCNAVLRAAILEGEVYILTVEKEGKREIASWAVLFPPGRALLRTQVFFWHISRFISQVTKLLQ